MINEKGLLEIVTYLISSARGCIDEPKIYGSFRLLDTTTRLYELLDKEKIENNKISGIMEKIDNNKYNYMTDEEGFKLFLDDLIEEIVDLT